MRAIINYQLTFLPCLCQGVLDGLEKLGPALPVIKESYSASNNYLNQDVPCMPQLTITTITTTIIIIIIIIIIK